MTFRRLGTLFRELVSDGKLGTVLYAWNGSICHVQVSLAASNDTHRRRRHLETRAPQSQGLNSGSPRSATERGGEVDVESMLQTLRLKFGYSDQLLRNGLKVVQTFSHKSTASEPVATEPVMTWSAAMASTA